MRAHQRVRLQFEDPVEEAGFQADLNRALLPIVRAGVAGGLWLWPALGLALISIGSVNVGDVLAVVTAMTLMNVLILLALLRPRSLHAMEWLGTFACSLSAIAVVALVPISGVSALVVFVVPGLMLVSTYAFVVFQLPAASGLAVSAVCLAAYLLAPLPRAGAAATALDLILVGSSVGLGAMAAYLLERSMRDRYRQGRLIASQSVEIEAERAKSDRLLLNVLPARIAARLRETPGSLAEQFDEASVLFADLVNFTALAERLGPQRTADMLNDLVSRFDDLADQHGLEKIKTIGDAYLVVGGVPEAMPDHAERVVSMGLAMVVATTTYAGECGLPLALRVGVHSGPVVAGVIGRTKFAYDVWGDTVNVAARLETAGLIGEVQVSEATAAAIGDQFELEARGPIELKGKGSVPTFIVRRSPSDRGPG